MKSVFFACLAISGFLITSQAQATGTEVRGVARISPNQLELKLFSDSDVQCNTSRVSLNYESSGRAVFGPHFYEVEALAVTRMACLQPAEFSAVVEIPANLPVGSVMIIRGTNGSFAEIEL